MGDGVIGSPTASGSVSLGSSPGTPARKQDLLEFRTTAGQHGPAVSRPRTPPSHGGSEGSNPFGATRSENPRPPGRGFSAFRAPAPEAVRTSGKMTLRTAPSSSGLGRRP